MWIVNLLSVIFRLPLTHPQISRYLQHLTTTISVYTQEMLLRLKWTGNTTTINVAHCHRTVGVNQLETRWSMLSTLHCNTRNLAFLRAIPGNMAGLMTPVASTATATATTTTAGIVNGCFSTLSGNVPSPLASEMTNDNQLVNESVSDLTSRCDTQLR